MSAEETKDTTTETPRPHIGTTHNVLQQMSTLLGILNRTPDLNIQINDVFNFFHICMPFFKNKVFYNNVFEEFYTKDHPEQAIIKATIDMLMIRYKDQFGYEDLEMLSPESFQMLLMQSVVHEEEYEMFTGLKMEMDPKIDINNLDLDPSKMETMHIDPKDMETIQMSDQGTGSPLLDDAINAELKDKINKTN